MHRVRLRWFGGARALVRWLFELQTCLTSRFAASRNLLLCSDSELARRAHEALAPFAPCWFRRPSSF